MVVVVVVAEEGAAEVVADMMVVGVAAVVAAGAGVVSAVAADVGPLPISRSWVERWGAAQVLSRRRVVRKEQTALKPGPS